MSAADGWTLQLVDFIFEKNFPNVVAVHCVIHRQRFVTKNHLEENKLDERSFRKLCDENDEDFNSLLLYTEVRWLLTGTSLKGS